jgi:hypothetical protein
VSDAIDPQDIERLKIRQIIADIDQKRVDAELKRAQLPLENRRFMLQLVATVAAAFVAGGTVAALIIRGLHG